VDHRWALAAGSLKFSSKVLGNRVGVTDDVAFEATPAL
jgi:hypothetical protein